MLSVAVVHDASARYYLGDLGDELRRVAPARAGLAARWMGSSALPLGLAGTVGGSGLSSLLRGEHPESGRPLVRSRRSVVGFDLTFSSPKGVSILFAMGPPGAADAVTAAHDEAVDRAVGYLERRALAVRRGSGDERVTIGADGLVGAGFAHCLSRSGDPHLHTHVVVANLAHGADGRWSAIDGRGLFAHARAAGALYDAHLRAVLAERLSVGWAPRPNGRWELAGADPLLLGAFSGRRAEIAEAMSRAPSRSARARHVAWASTRDPKPSGAGRPEPAGDWARRRRLAGEAAIALGARPHGALDEHRFAAEIAAAPPAGVHRRDVVVAWGAGAPVADASELERAVDHWVPPGGGIGVAEAPWPPAYVVPAPHLLAALGPRPLQAGGQDLWRQAAATIDRYRARWGVTGPSALEERPALATFPARRLAERLEVQRTVREALVRLDGRPVATLERDGVSIGRA